MELVLIRKDWVRLQILSRKISKRHMNEKGLESLKIEYFRYMTLYYIHEKMTLDASKAFLTMYDTMVAMEAEWTDETKKSNSFENFVIFLLLSKFETEKQELLTVVKEKYAREFEKHSKLQKYVDNLMGWELYSINEQELKGELGFTGPFSPSFENNVENLENFIKQLI